MANTTSKVLAGCGIGCLLLVLLVVGLGWMGFRWARDAAGQVQSAEQIGAELEERYGAVRDFTPPAGGVSAERLDVFLAIRDELAAPRARIEEAVDGLQPGAVGGVVVGVRTARSMMALAPRILELVAGRDRALLDHGMGLGEYTWIYWLAYTAWLGHPADESALHEVLEARSAEDDSFQMHVEGMETERLTWRLRNDIGAMLERLADELAEVPERQELRAAVLAELEVLAEDPGRIPFADGAPPGLVEGLEPYRERLEASYSPTANPFELGQID